MNKSSEIDFFGKRVIKNFFSKEEVSAIAKEIEKIINEEDRKDYVWKYFEKDRVRIKRIEYFTNYNSFFKNLSISSKILEVVNGLMGDESILFKDKINFKYGDSEHFKPHQDVCAGWGKYSDYHITFAIPLADVSKENGAIYFGERQTIKLTEDFKDLDEDYPLGDLAEIKMGDVLVFDSYIPHASYKNNTDQPRTMLFFTYTSKKGGNCYEIYHEDKFKVVPPDIYKVKGRKYKSGNSNEEEKEF